jgi:hypothetical protein
MKTCIRTRQKERTSFLKKRSKKLFFAVAEFSASARQKNKSFLVLFFKKEHPCLSLAVTALSAWLVIPPFAAAQIPGQNPDWPCAQRLVQTLVPGSYWNGPPVPEKTNWRDDEKIFTLATEIIDRDTPDADALAKLNAYADTIPQDQRAKTYPFLFGALVDQTNDQRSILIQRIEQLGHRQREMGDTISKISNQADADPTNGELTGKRDFDIRVFRETQFTMRYACEAPANMERRLGQFAHALEAKLGK